MFYHFNTLPPFCRQQWLTSWSMEEWFVYMETFKRLPSLTVIQSTEDPTIFSQSRKKVQRKSALKYFLSPGPWIPLSSLPFPSACTGTSQLSIKYTSILPETQLKVSESATLSPFLYLPQGIKSISFSSFPQEPFNFNKFGSFPIVIPASNLFE